MSCPRLPLASWSSRRRFLPKYILCQYLGVLCSQSLSCPTRVGTVKEGTLVCPGVDASTRWAWGWGQNSPGPLDTWLVWIMEALLGCSFCLGELQDGPKSSTEGIQKDGATLEQPGEAGHSGRAVQANGAFLHLGKNSFQGLPRLQRCAVLARLGYSHFTYWMALLSIRAFRWIDPFQRCRNSNFIFKMMPCSFVEWLDWTPLIKTMIFWVSKWSWVVNSMVVQ